MKLSSIKLTPKQTDTKIDLSSELRDTAHCPSSDRVTLLSKKMVTLGKTYVHSERYFPLGKFYFYSHCQGVYSMVKPV